jgi:NAD(P)-dependent dehydrogenase (short-subunit alcohol dehydrogenase family)
LLFVRTQMRCFGVFDQVDYNLAGPVNCTKAPPTFVITRPSKANLTQYNISSQKYTVTCSIIQSQDTNSPKAIMSRPGVTRTASTNIGGASSNRVLEGKIAIVTGASRGMFQLTAEACIKQSPTKTPGIGAAVCENLASKGCSLIMNYTSDSSESITTELAERLQKEHGIKTLPVQADMGSENGPAHLVATALNHFAHPKTRKLQIDIIINNAGVASNLPIEKCNVEDFDFVYRVNVRGPLFLMKAAIPYLPTDRSGRIVNVSSVSASCGFSDQSVYGGSKAAVEAMTRTWARELAERTTVNAINPGPVMTGMYSLLSVMPGYLLTVQRYVERSLRRFPEGYRALAQEHTPSCCPSWCRQRRSRQGRRTCRRKTCKPN